VRLVRQARNAPDRDDVERRSWRVIAVLVRIGDLLRPLPSIRRSSVKADEAYRSAAVNDDRGVALIRCAPATPLQSGPWRRASVEPIAERGQYSPVKVMVATGDASLEVQTSAVAPFGSLRISATAVAHSPAVSMTESSLHGTTMSRARDIPRNRAETRREADHLIADALEAVSRSRHAPDVRKLLGFRWKRDRVS
jgi:hypothetical protein